MFDHVKIIPGMSWCPFCWIGRSLNLIGLKLPVISLPMHCQWVSVNCDRCVGPMEIFPRNHSWPCNLYSKVIWLYTVLWLLTVIEWGLRTPKMSSSETLMVSEWSYRGLTLAVSPPCVMPMERLIHCVNGGAGSVTFRTPKRGFVVPREVDIT